MAIIIVNNKSAHKSTRGACFRCGRKSHWISNCYAKSHINGDSLVDELSDSD